MDAKKRILIIEDDLIIANHLRLNLIQMGYEVVGMAVDYQSAIELINSTSIDLALIDVQLEGEKTGIDVAMYLKQHNEYTPFIFLTSYVDGETIYKVRMTNPSGYLTKPFVSASVFSTIEIALYNADTRRKEEIIVISEGTRSFNLKRSQIVYVESDHIYSKVITPDGYILVRASISALHLQLPPETFLRVHRSYVVNIEHVKSVTVNWVLTGSYKIPLGKKYKDVIRKGMSAGKSSHISHGR